MAVERIRRNGDHMRATGKPMSILLVDDEPRLRETLARALTAHGYLVEQAGTHREAVAAALAGDHRLMMLDVNLPDATGWDVLRDLAAAGKSPPAVVFSAVPPSAARIREFKPFGVLHKPFPIESLIRLAQKAEERE
jgi:DNA-binding response OmpR family regulator